MKRYASFLVFMFLLCSSSPGRAQNSISQGSITGRVTDPSGAVVPEATVLAINLNTGVKTSTTTGATGSFNFPALPVGSYSLAISKSGFESVDVGFLEVHVGQTVTEDVQLKVGSATTTLTVAAAAPLLRPDQSTSSAVVGQSLIQNLPLNGRRYTDFTLLTPNANADGEFGLVSFGGQQGGGDSGYANGNGASSYTVDGANFTSSYFGGARGRTRVPYIFGENAIQEFQVADSPYSAAYGGAGAGFIDTVTRSGATSSTATHSITTATAPPARTTPLIRPTAFASPLTCCSSSAPVSADPLSATAPGSSLTTSSSARSIPSR